MEKNKLVLLLSSLLLAFGTTAQSFDGIEVGNSLAQTQHDLIMKGFRYIYTFLDDIGYEGTLPTGEHVMVTLATSPQKKIVWGLDVRLPGKISWDSLKADYKKYKSILTQKYGRPRREAEGFVYPNYDGDGHEMESIFAAKIYYSCAFKVERIPLGLI